MSRAAFLMFRRGPCGCFIELCAAAGGTLVLIAALILRRLSRLDEISLSDCQITPRHFTEAKYLTESDSKDQKNVGDLAAFTLDL